MKDAALSFGVEGWVRNRDDGAVEALVQGEEANVERLLSWARMGPPGAEVISLERQKIEGCSPQRGFHVIVQGSAR
jgi:acylphosphatase